MTIGTPYNFTETNIKNKSEMLADFIKGKEAIPTTLHMYSVAGTITYDSDELSRTPVFPLGNISTKTKQLAIRRLR